MVADGVNEQGEVILGTTRIGYTVVRSQRRKKTVAIKLDPAVGVLVLAPSRTPAKRIQEIVEKWSSWIVRKTPIEVLLPRSRLFVSGESLLYLGREMQLAVDPGSVRWPQVSLENGEIRVLAPQRLEGTARRGEIERALTRWYRQRATEWLEERVRHWGAISGLAPKVVKIRDQRQRWGSCSADGTLRFNWRIIMAPPDLIDYVVVHELVHLRVMNHSSAFWAGVTGLMPDFQQRRARLRDLGPRLTL